MRGELDDALARMARREELLRRRSAPVADHAPTPAEEATVPGPGSRSPMTGSRSPNAGLRPPPETIHSSTESIRSSGPESIRSSGEPLRSSADRFRLRTDAVRAPVDVVRAAADEVVEAVRRVLAHHPAVTVDLTVEQGGSRTAIRLTGADGTGPATPASGLPSRAAPPEPPSWPLSPQPVPGWGTAADDRSGDSAARLAELIRRDPSLLGGTDEQ